MLWCHHLSRRLSSGRYLLRDISLEIGAGEFVAIIGPSGCGKSTLLKTLAGLETPTSGELRVAGHPVGPLREQFPLAIGYLPQFPEFHDDLTVAEILLFAASLRLPGRVTKEQRKEWLRHLVKLSGLEGLVGQRYSTLSGGQRRRVALAEELVGDPPLLLLDELTSGLDPHAEQELMSWLASLAGETGKTIALVTHATGSLPMCGRVLFLHSGRLIYNGDYPGLLEACEATTIEDVYRAAEKYIEDHPVVGEVRRETPEERAAVATPEETPLRTGRPPGAARQLPALLRRQLLLMGRDRGQMGLHLLLLLSFPALVALFATGGLPQVRNLSLELPTNVLTSLVEQLKYVGESFAAAALVSGLAMFQVILLTLMGSNNGAREIARERGTLTKELRAGLSPGAYLAVKLMIAGGLCVAQSGWMAWFVKTICGFPGDLSAQFAALLLPALAMSCTCLMFSALARTPERASLLAIYLVGLQLPLSGAILALPESVTELTRPFIAAYWGWSAYLRTLEEFRHFGVVAQATKTAIAPYGLALSVLAGHCLASIAATRWLLGRRPAG